MNDIVGKPWFSAMASRADAERRLAGTFVYANLFFYYYFRKDCSMTDKSFNAMFEMLTINQYLSCAHFTSNCFKILFFF